MIDRPVPSLSIVLPMFDEEAGIATAVDELRHAAVRLEDEGHVRGVELVLVDDGSRDGSLTAARALAARLPEVRVLAHDRNRGLGAALRTGLGGCRNDLVLYTDSDLPAPASAMGEALALVSDPAGDVVSAHRRNRRPDGLRRLLYSILYNRMIAALFGLRVEDVNFAYKLFPRAAAAQLDLRSEGSFIDAELLIGLSRQGLVITQFPVEYRPRGSGRSTLSRFPVILGIIKEMVAFGRRTGWRR